MFYEFKQNNSWGAWKEPAYLIIVEADSNDEADNIAEANGVYFSGLGDCPCCGFRWSHAWADDGEKIPSHYGDPIAEAIEKDDYFKHRGLTIPYAIVIYKDGRKEVYDGKEK